MPQQSFGLGITVPSSNTVLERDYTHVLGLDGVSSHVSRVFNSEDTLSSNLQRCKVSSREAARLLGHPGRMKGIALGRFSMSRLMFVGKVSRLSAKRTSRA